MRKVTWLLAGAGDIGTRRVGPALVHAEKSELIAICDLDRERAARLAAKLGVKTVFTDYGKALAESGADAVYIATPQGAHVDMSIQALMAGKHFLCEKPISVNGSEGLRLLQAVRGSRLVTSCSNYRRLSGQYKVTVDMLRRHEIGKLYGGWAIYSTPFYNPSHHPVKKALGMSRIKELGYYQIDIAQNIFGMPESVVAHASIINKAVMNDVEDIVTVVLKFRGGELFTIILNSGTPLTRHELEIFGNKGSIYWQHWPPHGNGPVCKITPQATETFDVHTDDNYHLPMVQDYVDALLDGRQPVCTVESAAKTEIITDAIFRSIENGRVEPVVWKE
jgi:predicted dehydrogenase